MAILNENFDVIVRHTSRYINTIATAAGIVKWISKCASICISIAVVTILMDEVAILMIISVNFDRRSMDVYLFPILKKKELI